MAPRPLELAMSVLAGVHGGDNPKAQVVRMTIDWLRTRRNPMVESVKELDNGSKLRRFSNHAITYEPAIGDSQAYQTWLAGNHHERNGFYIQQVRDAIRDLRGK
jgi:hypothetical protein